MSAPDAAAAGPTFRDFLDAWDLFADPILAAAIGGAVLGYLSVYIVLKRMVFVSATVTQSAGLGVALAFYAEIHLATHVDPLLGAVVLSLATTLLLLQSFERFHLSRESLLGLAFATAGAGAVLIGDRIVQEAHDIQAILFGTAVLVDRVDLWWIAVCGTGALVLHLLFFRAITFANFDAEVARVQGVPVKLFSGFVLVSIGLMVGVTAKALGALPVFALSTLPALAALVLGLSYRWCFALGTVLGAAAGTLGYLFAFFYEYPVGASQAGVAVALVLVALPIRAVRTMLQRSPA